MPTPTAETPARHAQEYRHNVGPDYSLADAYDPDYLDVEAVEDVELMTTAERQELNARMFAFYFG